MIATHFRHEVLPLSVGWYDRLCHSADTLIVWNDPWLETEMALSFQSVTGCQQFWCARRDVVHKIRSGPIGRTVTLSNLSHSSTLWSPQMGLRFSLSSWRRTFGVLNCLTSGVDRPPPVWGVGCERSCGLLIARCLADGGGRWSLGTAKAWARSGVTWGVSPVGAGEERTIG